MEDIVDPRATTHPIEVWEKILRRNLSNLTYWSSVKGIISGLYSTDITKNLWYAKAKWKKYKEATEQKSEAQNNVQ